MTMPTAGIHLIFYFFWQQRHSVLNHFFTINDSKHDVICVLLLFLAPIIYYYNIDKNLWRELYEFKTGCFYSLISIFELHDQRATFKYFIET